MVTRRDSVQIKSWEALEGLAIGKNEVEFRLVSGEFAAMHLAASTMSIQERNLNQVFESRISYRNPG